MDLWPTVTRQRFIVRTCACLGAAAIAIAASQPSWAQDVGTTIDAGRSGDAGIGPGAGPSDRLSFTLGAVAALVPDYEGSEDYEFVAGPLLRVQRGPQFVALRGLKLTSNVLPEPNWRFGPVLNYRGERDDVDNDAVDDLSDVDAAFEIGLTAGYEAPLAGGMAGVNVEYLVDVTDGHDGWLLTPSVDYGGPISQRLRGSVELSTTYASDDYMQSYFGINAGDAARSGLSQFNADEGFKDVGLSGALFYSLTDRWSVGALGSWTLLVDDAADSPVTDDEGDENQFFGGLLLTYSW
ncbi:MAG: MipA/OmpV family protein [Minwuiales bacterium]|nr:MipA/OmpV family protein [Minwuiales bacterium]